MPCKLTDDWKSAGLVALGHLHGIETAESGELPEIELAEALMLTCYEMYRRVPAGLSPEIVFFTAHEDSDAYPKQHATDVGGGDFHVKPAVSSPCPLLSHSSSHHSSPSTHPHPFPPVLILSSIILSCAVLIPSASCVQASQIFLKRACCNMRLAGPCFARWHYEIWEYC